MNNSSFYFRSRFGIFIPEARSFFKYAFSARRSSISFSNCCSLVNFLSVFFFGFLDIDGRPFGLESPSFPLHCHTLYQERISEGSGISKCKAILLKESPVINVLFLSKPFFPYFQSILTPLRIFDSPGTSYFLAIVRYPPSPAKQASTVLSLNARSYLTIKHHP